MKKTVMLGILVVIALFVVGCGSSEPKPAAPAAPAKTASAAPAAPAANSKETVKTVGEISFTLPAGWEIIESESDWNVPINAALLIVKSSSKKTVKDKTDYEIYVALRRPNPPGAERDSDYQIYVKEKVANSQKFSYPEVKFGGNTYKKQVITDVKNPAPPKKEGFESTEYVIRLNGKQTYTAKTFFRDGFAKVTPEDRKAAETILASLKAK